MKGHERKWKEENYSQKVYLVIGDFDFIRGISGCFFGGLSLRGRHYFYTKLIRAMLFIACELVDILNIWCLKVFKKSPMKCSTMMYKAMHHKFIYICIRAAVYAEYTVSMPSTSSASHFDQKNL